MKRDKREILLARCEEEERWRTGGGTGGTGGGRRFLNRENGARQLLEAREGMGRSRYEKVNIQGLKTGRK